MARSLHELAARIERWSGAASTPPPAAPPLPDPTMQALSERFPGAPEHWLRLVASRMGQSAIGAAVGSARTAETTRAAPTPPAPGRVPRPAPPRPWPIPLGFGRKPRGPPGQPPAAARSPPRRTPQVHGFEAPAPGPAIGTPAFPAADHPGHFGGQDFDPPRRKQRFAPEFPSAGKGSRVDTLQFAAPVSSSPRAALALPRDGLGQEQAQPAFAGPPALPPSGSEFAPIGGEWRSGYEVRQPGERRNIWPTPPPSDHALPDAQPLHADEEASRLEQMVARWSA